MAIRTTGVRYDLIARDSASRVFGKVERSARGLDGGMGSLARSVAKAGAVLGTGLAVSLAVSADKAVKFQAEMLKISTQAGATTKDVAVLSKQVLDLGKSTQQGPEALSASLYHLKSVGMDNVEAMKALKTSSDLAAVGGADLEATTNALAGAWRTGIRGATDFGQAAATVNAIIGAGNMSMEDLTAALGTGILPTAKTFGLTFSQVGAALALFTDEGVDSASAATRLRMSISLLAAPSKAAEKQLAKIGLTGTMLGEAMRSKDGIIGAITLLSDHLKKSGLDATHQAALLSRAFGGGKSSSAILSMVNNLDVLEKKQIQVNSSMGKYGPAVAAQRKTVAAQLSLIKSNLDVFAIEAGNKLLPPITSFVVYINKTALPAINAFGHDLVHKFIPVDQIEAGFRTIAQDVSDFMAGLKGPKKAPILPVQPKLVLPKNLPPDAFNFGASIRPVIRPTVKLPSNLPPDALQFGASIRTKVIAPKNLPPSAIRYGITPHISTPGPAVKSAAEKAGDQLRLLISGGVSGGIGAAVKGLDWSSLGHEIGGGLATAIGWVGEHTADLTKQFGSVLAKINWVEIGKSFGATAIPLAIGIVNSLFAPLFTLSFWEDHWLDTILAVLSVIPIGRVAGPLGKLVEKIPILKIFTPLLHGIEAIGKPIEGAVGKMLKFFGRSLWSGIARVFPEATAVLETEAGLFTTRIGVWGLRLVEAGGRAMRGLGSGISRGFGWVFAKIGEGIAQMLRPFVAAGGWLIERGTAFVSGLRSGIVRGATRLGGWVTDHVVSPARGAFSSAGSWLYGRGQAFVTGLKDGAVSIGKGIGRWFHTNIISPAVGAFSTASGWLTGAGRSMITGLTDGALTLLSDAKSGVMHWASTIKDKIVGAIKSVFHIHSPSRVMAELGGHIMSGLLKGLLSGKDILKSTVKGLFHSPLDAAAALLKNGVSLPAQWVSKLLGAKAPRSADVPLSLGVASAQSYAANLVAQLWPKGAGAEMDALRSLWNAESGWRANAENMSSGAYGIPQSLPANKMASAGSDWKTNAATQIRWGLDYIRGRYGDPITAWASWNAHSPHWYAAGGMAPFGQTAWVGERGPELMQVTRRGTRIYSNPDSMAIAGGLGMQVPGYARGTVSLGAARSDVAAAQRRVNDLEKQITALRHAEATAHTKRQRKADQLAVMAAEQELKAARTRLTAANRELSTAQAQAKRVQGIANQIQNGFLKTLETGSAAAIASAIKSLNSKLQTAGFGNMVAGNPRTSSRMQSLANQRSSVQSQIAAAKQYASDQASSLGDFLSLGNTPASSSLSSLISRMQKSQSTAAGFASEITSLSKRGLDKSLLSQLAEAGPGSQLANLFLKANTSDIAQLNKLAASQKKLTTSFGNTMADAMFDSGAQAGKGFLTGLLAQEKAIQAELNRLALGMVTTVEHKLGIKSPSTVTRDRIGKQFALGAALGVRIYTPHAVREAARMADTMAAVRARSGAVAVGAGGGQVVHHTEHHTHYEYEINARTADFSPQELDLLQRRTEARQRVGRPR